MNDDDIPTLVATRSASGKQLVVWCIHCKCKHFHGFGGGGGHRQAHCWWVKSPYKQTGYNLVVEVPA